VNNNFPTDNFPSSPTCNLDSDTAALSGRYKAQGLDVSSIQKLEHGESFVNYQTLGRVKFVDINEGYAIVETKKTMIAKELREVRERVKRGLDPLPVCLRDCLNGYY